MKDRKDIEEKYTWNLNNIYSKMDDFDKDYSLTKTMIDDLNKYEKCMITSSNNFYEAIKLSYDIERKLDKLSVYASLSFDLDTSNNNKQELCEKVANLKSLYSRVSYFIVPSIMKCDYNRIEKFYEENHKLREYEVQIKEIYRYKDHTLSDEEERLLSSIGKIIGNCYDTYELFKDCDMSFGKIKDENGKRVEITNSNYSLYIESKDRNVRKSAFKVLYKEYKKYTNTFASLISTNMKEISTLAKIEKYDSAIAMSLYHDDIDISVYNNLIDSVHKNISYLYEYYNLKKEILGLDEIHLYDIYVPIVNDYDKKYSYEEAKKIIIEVLGVFGEEYINKVKEALDSRWIDVYPTRAKRTGGYSGGSYDTYPYILLNYQDKYSDMSTLIHEMGHSMHSYYSRTYNSYQNSEYRIFVAEVASTVNELLLSHYMLEHSESKEEKLFILNNLMELYRATVYRQTMFAEFEKIISDMTDKEEALTADKLSDIYYNLNKFYFGSDVVVDTDIRYEWERIPHFYYDFYVYKYATGLSAATAIVNNILSGKDGAVSKYIDFLKCGSRLSPIESLKVAGVDLTNRETVDCALNEFKKIIDSYRENM
ncbi:MAG: oligoendopeptidase F [Bacilli bacterium]